MLHPTPSPESDLYKYNTPTVHLDILGVRHPQNVQMYRRGVICPIQG